MTEKEMVLFLTKKGMSESRIAVKIGVSQPTVNRIKNGSSTNYQNGKALERLIVSVEAA